MSDRHSPHKSGLSESSESSSRKSRKSKRESRSISEKSNQIAHLELNTPSKASEDNENQISLDIGAHNYQIVCLLGVGSQGRVYLVRLINTEQYFAMKVFKKDRVLPNDKTTRSILTEHRFLATTDHPFVTKLYHSFHSYERLFMVMEFCPGGELFTTIRKQPHGRLTEHQVSFYASEVVLVLEYIHSRGYIYRDLKPENILLHVDGHIRMADFGLSKQTEGSNQMVIVERKEKTLNPFSKKKVTLDLQQGGVLRTSSLVGSVHYLAPEVVSSDSYDAIADWWAFGILLYDMLFGFPPFQGRSNKEIINKISICEYKFPDDIPISSALKSLIKGLLKLDPKKRVCAKNGASDIKRHPFFANTHWGLLRNRIPPIIPSISGPADTSNFEIYPGDEDSVDFNFFSELPEDPQAISAEDQKKFEDFHFTRDSFLAMLEGTQYVPAKPKKDRFSRSDSERMSKKQSTYSSKKCMSARLDRTKSDTIQDEESPHSDRASVPNLADPPIRKKKRSTEKTAKRKASRKNSPSHASIVSSGSG